MFDKSDCFCDTTGDKVGVCPGLGGQLGGLVASDPQEGRHLGVVLDHGAQHGLTGVSDELFTHQLQSSVNILLGVKEMFLHGWSRM